jgi:transposase InsO family protein
MNQHQSEFPVGLMSGLLEGSRSSYYAFIKGQIRKPSERTTNNDLLFGKIKVIFEQNKKPYGSPRVYKKLRQQGESCSLGRVKRLMRQAGLYALNPKKLKSKQEKSEVPETRNLLLDPANKPTAINQVWHSEMV